MDSSTQAKTPNPIIDWILRFFKGMVVGTGAILPGVSGGALAAVFGFYERIIRFLADIRKNFMQNFLYLLPIGLGGIVGVLLLSKAVDMLLTSNQVQVIWFFIGCIAGTFPALWKQAGKHGRQSKDYIILIVSTIVAFLFLMFIEPSLHGQSIPLNIGTWLLAGAIMGLGLIVPGLSPSNFLIYLNMYQPMVAGISKFDLSVILPIMIGVIACILLLSKVVRYLFDRNYAGVYHVILGIIIASTLKIIPTAYNYLSLGGLLCVVLCAAGFALGYLMSRLEDKYKPDEV